MKILVLADGQVGREAIIWLIDNFINDIGCVVCMEANEIFQICIENKVNVQLFSNIEFDKGQFDFGFLIWWPKIIGNSILNLASGGFINTHPSLLPHNRGKHPNFWALVEEVPFGVTLHFVGSGIDDGDIVAQEQIEYDWLDTGATLHLRGIERMISLFKNQYSLIRAGQFQRQKQEKAAGSYHLSKEIDPSSKIELDKNYKARDLLNIIRARTYKGYPSAYFEENGIRYNLRIEIEKSE